MTERPKGLLVAGVLCVFGSVIVVGATVAPRIQAPTEPGPIAPIFQTDEGDPEPWAPSQGPVVTDGRPLPTTAAPESPQSTQPAPSWASVPELEPIREPDPTEACRCGPRPTPTITAAPTTTTTAPTTTTPAPTTTTEPTPTEEPDCLVDPLLCPTPTIVPTVEPTATE